MAGVTKTTGVGILILLLLGAAGCLDLGFFESPVPLAPAAKAHMDGGLLGDWVRAPRDKEEAKDKGGGKDGEDTPQLIRFLAFNDHEYAVVSPEENGEGIVRAYHTRVGQWDFLNFQQLDREQKSFLFCRYRLTENRTRLTMQFVADDLLEGKEFKTSKKLLKFIKKHLDHQKLFDPELTIILRKK